MGHTAGQSADRFHALGPHETLLHSHFGGHIPLRPDQIRHDPVVIANGGNGQLNILDLFFTDFSGATTGPDSPLSDGVLNRLFEDHVVDRPQGALFPFSEVALKGRIHIF